MSFFSAINQSIQIQSKFWGKVSECWERVFNWDKLPSHNILESEGNPSILVQYIAKLSVVAGHQRHP